MFKDLVKHKIKIFEFSKLMEQRGSKTKELIYTQLKMQDYLHLENMTRIQAIALFKFRTRMAPFGENFRAGRINCICPLCFSHLDSQEESFNCGALKNLLQIRGRYRDIYTNNFSQQLISTIYNIYKYRKELTEL